MGAALLISCGGDSTGPRSGVAGVTISPDTDSLIVGTTAELHAVVRDSKGDTLAGRQIFWNSDHPDIATVSDQGIVTAVAPGSAHIAASSEGESDVAEVTVLPKPVASVTVSPGRYTLKIGQTVHLQATLHDADGNALTGRAVSWSSDNTAAARVDASSGVVTGVGPGTAVIKATSEGKQGASVIDVNAPTAASITVTPPSLSIMVGQTSQLDPTVKDADGATLSDALVTWTSNANNIASVSSTGLVRGNAPGTATIKATSGSVSRNVSVTVSPIPADAVVVSPSTETLIVGETVQLSAQVTDASGNVLSGRQISWSSSNSQIATVSSSGVVQAVAAGQVTITATSEGKSGSATVTVSPVPVAGVLVSPDAAGLVVGETVQLQATPVDANGNALPGRTITWSSSNTSVATISGSGSTVTVTGVGAGGATISAHSDGQVGISTITVTPVPVASVSVDPTSATLNPGDSVQLTATPRDANGNPLSRTVNWASSNTAIARVRSTGQGTAIVTAIAQGQALITATSESQIAQATINVNPAPVATVDVAPDTTIIVGATAQMRVTLKDANGNTLTGRTVTWSSSNTNVATVDANTGVVTGVAEGQATITATSEGKSGSATVTVSPVPVASVSVKPVDTTIVVDATAQMRVTVQDAGGNTLTDRPVTWSSSKPDVATVDPASGLVTGVAKGKTTISATSEGRTGTATVTVSRNDPNDVITTMSSQRRGGSYEGEDGRLFTEDLAERET